MDLIFCGTPQFAVPTLAKLLEEKFTIQLVVTNPDEPSGRGYELKVPPVKEAALRAGLPIFQPAKLKVPETIEFLSRFHPDAIVVVAYGHIIPHWMIDQPRLGCINLHGSLLPKYRGAAPIQWALIRGERVTGVTTMKIDAGLDTGPMLLRKELEVHDDDTTETLFEKLSQIGASLMIETLRGLGQGTVVPCPQDSSKATLAPMLKKEDGRIDWTLSATEIGWRVRGLRPWPGAYSTLRGKNIHIWAAAPVAARPSEGWIPGTLLPEHGKLFVACGQGTMLEVKEIQLEGRKRLSAREFLNGIRLAAGEKLG